LLPLLQEHDIGWLAWSWWPDQCEERQMTSSGYFSDLTPYGDDIANNPIYDLKATAVKPPIP
jgi:mannan endo-1,4-beta-mannosidase